MPTRSTKYACQLQNMFSIRTYLLVLSIRYTATTSTHALFALYQSPEANVPVSFVATQQLHKTTINKPQASTTVFHPVPISPSLHLSSVHRPPQTSTLQTPTMYRLQTLCCRSCFRDLGKYRFERCAAAVSQDLTPPEPYTAICLATKLPSLIAENRHPER